ncbi:MAG: penicillin-binding protein activator [Burkholderiales bacterium]|nr:penicillin-binding protein activator [Burkholderiales bacterium]
MTAILYGGTTAFASKAAFGAQPLPGGKPAADTSLATADPGAGTAVPHIGLLLPVGQPPFARPAEAVRDGFMAAAKAQGGSPLPIRIHAISEEDGPSLIDGYRRALDAGARMVVGPLTRSGVTALAASDGITVPTLALSAPDGGGPLPQNLFILSLQIEAEARQVAQLAFREGRLNAYTITGDTPLQRRMHQAFVDEFSRLGGKHIAEFAATPDQDGLNRLKQAAALGVADMAFLALDFQRARQVRPYLDPLALYATSQVNRVNAGPLAGFDLANIRLLEMPWLLQPDHPAVMIYPRKDFGDAIDLDRLYALGIDAFRIAQELINGRTELMLDGVTGHITTGRDRHFVRELLGARFSDGRLIPDSAKP